MSHMNPNKIIPQTVTMPMLEFIAHCINFSYKNTIIYTYIDYTVTQIEICMASIKLKCELSVQSQLMY